MQSEVGKMELELTLGLLAWTAVVLGALVFGAAAQSIGETRTGIEWLVDALAFVVKWGSPIADRRSVAYAGTSVIAGRSRRSCVDGAAASGSPRAEARAKREATAYPLGVSSEVWTRTRTTRSTPALPGTASPRPRARTPLDMIATRATRSRCSATSSGSPWP